MIELLSGGYKLEKSVIKVGAIDSLEPPRSLADHTVLESRWNGESTEAFSSLSR